MIEESRVESEFSRSVQFGDAAHTATIQDTLSLPPPRDCFSLIILPGNHFARLFLFVGIMMTGCGGPALVPVSGTVTLDGQPLAGAYVTFEPVEGALELVSMGVTDTSGRYTLSCGEEPGAIPGKHRIQLTTVAPGSHADELTALPQDRVPLHYQDGTLTRDVPEEGTDAADFPLVTRR
jgi:hypothetical protein